MRFRTLIGFPVLVWLLSSGCALPVQTRSARPVLPPPRYDYRPTPPCDAPGSGKLTIAVVSPQFPAQPQQQAQGSGYAAPTPSAVTALVPAMRDDFFELVTCRGYFTKGPFASFQTMVYPDREGSQLILEPELQIRVAVTSASVNVKNLFGQSVPAPAGQAGIVTGTASVGGHVALTLKEPITNTRMWTRSIEVSANTFSFTTDERYVGGLPLAQLRYAVINDEGLRRALQPNLEGMYQDILKTAESYLNQQELSMVARQATDVRKKAAIAVPPR